MPLFVCFMLVIKATLGISYRGEAGKGGRWAKGAVNDILIVTCMK